MITYDFTIFTDQKTIENLENLIKTPVSEITKPLHNAPLYSYTKPYNQEWFTTKLTVELITDNSAYPYFVIKQKSRVRHVTRTYGLLQTSKTNMQIHGKKNNRKITLSGTFDNSIKIIGDTEVEFRVNICKASAENIPEAATVTTIDGTELTKTTIQNRQYLVNLDTPILIDIANTYIETKSIRHEHLDIIKITDEWSNTLWSDPIQKTTITIIETKHGSISTHHAVEKIYRKIKEARENKENVAINNGEYSLNPDDIIQVYKATIIGESVEL